MHIYPLQEPNQGEAFSSSEPNKTTSGTSDVHKVEENAERRNWSPKYLIDPANSNSFNMSICQDAIAQSIVVMVLSSHQNYDLR